MTKQQADPLATPMTVRDVLLLVLQADAYPILGNEDVPVALRMEKAALQHAETAVSSPDDPPEFARWLAALRQPGIGQGEREEVLGAMYAYFDPEETL
jgi:hypothetical protein